MPKVLHHLFSDKDKWLDPTGRTDTTKEFDNYVNSPDFSEKEYINFLSGKYYDDFYSIGDTIKKLENSKFNTPENNDKIVSNVLKSKIKDRDESFYWRSDYIRNIFENLKYSKKSIDHIIDFAKKTNDKGVIKNLFSDEVIESPKLTTEQLRAIVKDVGFISHSVFKSPKMKKSLFDEILESKGHQYSKLTDAMDSNLLDSENALKILNNGGITSSIYLDKLLSKIPKASRNEYIKDRLGITGGEKSPAEEGYENDWFYGPKRDHVTAKSIVESKYLTSDVIEHIKKYGDFDEKYSLFTNEHIDANHSVEMASKWANNEEGYDEDDLKERLKEENEDDLWETYSDEARDQAQEEYPMDRYLRDIGDDEVSKTLFDKDYNEWKKDWIADNKDLTGPNPHFDPEEPESDDNPKTIPYDGSYGRDLDVQDHPDYADFESDADQAFEEAKNTADMEPFYDGYDEYIREDIERNVYDLRDEDLNNWTESNTYLPNRVREALQNPFKDRENPTEKEFSDALNHPLKIVKRSAAENPKLPTKLIDRVLKSDDNDLKQRVLENPNITSDQLMKVIKKEKNEEVAASALKNIKTKPEHVQEAINKFPESSYVIRSALNSHAANDDHVKNFLNIVKKSKNPTRYDVESVINSKFNLSPEDVNFIYSTAEKNNMLDSMSGIIRHHSSTKDVIEKALNNSNATVRVAANEAKDRRFPQSADPVNLRIGTHPLRILRDLISEQGGTTTKGKLKNLGVNADRFNQIFKPNGTISAEDVQKVIDSVPAKKYNTSHSTWSGGQRHSDEPSKVFQLNYTQEQLDEMQKEGVLDTFKKIYDVSFNSGHPVKNNTIGWVRYTGSPEEGFHIDEIQTDLGQSIIKQTISQAKHAVENEGMDPEEAERAISNAKKKFPDEHLKKINQILFGDKHPSEVLHEAFKEYYRNKGFADAPIHIWQPESKAPISGMSTSTRISPSYAETLVEDAKKGRLGSDSKALISWGQKNKLAPASLKEVTTEHLDQIVSGYKEFANKHREQHNNDPELPVQLPVHMTEGYGKIPKSMGYKESFYGKLPTQKAKEHLQQTTPTESGEPLVTPAKTTYEDKIRKQEELEKAPTPYDISSEDDVDHNTYKNIKKIVHTDKDNKGFIHKVLIDPKNENEILHTLHSPKGEKIAQLKITRELPNDVPGGQGYDEENVISHVTVSPDSKYRGKGFGRKLYLNALKYHKSLTSDSTISPMANKVWKKISKLKNVHTELAPYNDYDSTPHRAEWMGRSEELNKTPIVDPAYGDVSILSDSHHNFINEYAKKKTKTKKYKDFYIHTTGPKDSTYHYITENNKPDGKIVSYVLVNNESDSVENTPYISNSVTQDKYRNKGLSSALHQFAANYNKGIYSDSRLSPKEHSIWKKNSRTKLGQTFETEDAEEPEIESLENEGYGQQHFLNEENKTKKQEELDKGSLQRKFKFNPKELKEDDLETITSWSEGGETDFTRSKIPQMSSNSKIRALNKLMSRTKWRKNNQTGEREFLLHRQMGDYEFSKKVNNEKISHDKESSWTPNLDRVLKGIYPPNDLLTLNRYNHIVSAWIPESKIKTFLPQYGKIVRGELQNEQETILHPHSSEIHQIYHDDRIKNFKEGWSGDEQTGFKDWKWKKIFSKSEELDKGLKGDWQKEGYTIREADPGKFYDYAVEAVHPEHGVVGRARFKAHQSGNFLIPGDVVVKEDHQRKGIGSGLYQHAAKIYAPIKNLASHQTVAAHGMWEKAGKTFNKEELNKGKIINPPDIPKVTPDSEEYFSGISYEGDFPEVKEAAKRGKTFNFPLTHENLKNVHLFHDETLEEHGDKESAEWAKENPELARKHPIVIARHPDGSLHITDGQHRFNSALKSGKTHVRAFIFNVPKEYTETIVAPVHISEYYPQFKKSEDDSPSILYHYSNQSGLKEIDPKKMGTGTPGEFKSKFNPSQIQDFPHASFHYIKDKPEDMVRGAAKSKYVLQLSPDQKLYDIGKDKDNLVRDAVKENQGAWNYEKVLKKIKDSGYYGVMARNHENPVIANTAMLFYNHPAGKESKP